MKNEMNLKIEGMSCNHCAATVKNAIEKIQGVESVKVDLNEKSAYISGAPDKEEIIKAIDSAGYKVVS